MLPTADPAQDGASPDFVVIDVETSCSRVSSICQIGIVGFRGGSEAFSYETLVDPCDDFHGFNTRIHGIRAEHVAGQPHFGMVHAMGSPANWVGCRPGDGGLRSGISG